MRLIKKNTEGVNRQTETIFNDFRVINKEKSVKKRKILRGSIGQTETIFNDFSGDK